MVRKREREITKQEKENYIKRRKNIKKREIEEEKVNRRSERETKKQITSKRKQKKEDAGKTKRAEK